MTSSRPVRFATLALVTVGLACDDAPGAPITDLETAVVSLVGVGSDAAGVVVVLTGATDHIEAVSKSLEVAWARDGNVATVAILGQLQDMTDLVLVTRPRGVDALRAEVREVASTDGVVSSPPATRALVRTTAAVP